MSAGDTFLGLDISTQRLKAVLVDDNLKILFEEAVEYHSDLPEFRTNKGVIQSKDSKTIVSPTIMWIKALDMVLDKLQLAGADFSGLAAVSGCGQQHGTVYWHNDSESVMQNLDSSNFLHAQMASCFTVPNSPVWMDSSTSEYCKKIEKHVGGAEKLARITGSTAYERFSGPQIAKIADTKKSAYDNTERISLISSFGACIMLGKYAPIDFSDGSGMNLLDLQTKMWDETCLEACAPNLADKLCCPVPSDADLGVISQYFVDRFAFNPNCRVVTFTGDNPASLIGMRVYHGDMIVSLGTSDTLIMWLPKMKVLLEGHVFINPLQCNEYMSMLCFKNGSVTRERFRDMTPTKSWEEFDKLLEKTPRGNFGNMAFIFDNEEIIPRVQGEFRFDKENKPVKKFGSVEAEIRAVIEGQFVAKRAHAEDLGFHVGADSRILATGGASANKAILQVIADVFNARVYFMPDEANSAVMGAAYLAKQGIRDRSKHPDPVEYFKQITSSTTQPVLACKPYSDSDQVYTPMVKRYRELIVGIVANN